MFSKTKISHGNQRSIIVSSEAKRRSYLNLLYGLPRFKTLAKTLIYLSPRENLGSAFFLFYFPLVAFAWNEAEHTTFPVFIIIFKLIFCTVDSHT